MTHLSRYDYEQSKQIETFGFTFSALIAAAYRKADGDNRRNLEQAFPDICRELHYRYWSGGGFLPHEPGYNPDYDDNLHRDETTP